MRDVYILATQRDSQAGWEVYLPDARVPCVKSDRHPADAAEDWLKKRGIQTAAKPRIFRFGNKITVLYELQRNKRRGWINSAEVLIQKTYDQPTKAMISILLTVV